MDTATLETTYSLIAELLLHPDERREARVEALRYGLDGAPPTVRAVLERFLDDERARTPAEYVQTLELAPPCPLYVGAYLFDEPTSCRGAGTSGRNGYMIELSALYRHFGMVLSGGELPDYLPVMVEFAALSLTRTRPDALGLRQSFLEHYLALGLPPMRQRLRRYESVYAELVEALEGVVGADLGEYAGTSAWVPGWVGRTRTPDCPIARLARRSPAQRRPAPEVSR